MNGGLSVPAGHKPIPIASSPSPSRQRPCHLAPRNAPHDPAARSLTVGWKLLLNVAPATGRIAAG